MIELCDGWDMAPSGENQKSPFQQFQKTPPTQMVASAFHPQFFLAV
jgi:hypothetical protein